MGLVKSIAEASARFLLYNGLAKYLNLWYSNHYAQIIMAVPKQHDPNHDHTVSPDPPSFRHLRFLTLASLAVFPTRGETAILIFRSTCK